ncbi:MAG: phosphatase PAP2 family protein [Gammaproteobacteria bacterium]|nr:phosphatase PAP2 family protein [Gammaproteobacteria bacterium]
MFKYWHDLLDSIAALVVNNCRVRSVMGIMSHERLLISTAAVLLILTVGIHGLDANKALFLWLQSWGRYVPESFWASLTVVGDGLTVAVLLLLFARKYPKMIWAAVLAALFTTLIVQSVKHSLVLPRPPLVLAPDEFMLIGPEYRHASFPSGHSTAIWLFASVWLFSAYHWSKAVVLMSLAALIALSRVMVGAHWPVDIAAGAFIGWVGGWAGVVMANRWQWGMTLKGQRIIVAVLLLAAVALIGHDSGYTQAGWVVNSIAVTCLLFGGYHFYILLRHPQRIDQPSDEQVVEDRKNQR